MSIEQPINYMIAQLEGMPFFSKVYGLCEMLDNGKGQIYPVFYTNASTQPKNVEINKLGAAYFRKRGPFTVAESQAQNYVACETLYTLNCPLRLVAITKREYFPSNNAFSADRLASTLIKAITTENGALRTQMSVRKVMIRARTYSTDIRTLKTEEFQGIQNPQFNLNDIAVGLDVDVIIETYSNCIEEACDYIPRFCLQLESYIALP